MEGPVAGVGGSCAEATRGDATKVSANRTRKVGVQRGGDKGWRSIRKAASVPKTPA
jgi:hypothetical protein